MIKFLSGVITAFILLFAKNKVLTTKVKVKVSPIEWVPIKCKEAIKELVKKDDNEELSDKFNELLEEQKDEKYF